MFVKARKQKEKIITGQKKFAADFTAFNKSR